MKELHKVAKAKEPMRTGFKVRKIITEEFPFREQGGNTPGDLLNAILVDSLREEAEIQSVELVLAPESLNALRERMG